MKIALDLDGTLERFPKQLIALAEILKSGGADVFVLTATTGTPGEVRKRLDDLGATSVRHVCVGPSDKPKYCVDNSVDILIDDTDHNLSGTIQLIPA